MINENLNIDEDKEIKIENSTEKDDNNELKNNELDNNYSEKRFFLMTLEDNFGQFQQLKIFKNSDPSELAFNFCKENNLDFNSMKFIKKSVKEIIKKFDESKQNTDFLNGCNSSIQEVDEENIVTEGTLKSDLIDSGSKELHLKKTNITKNIKKDLNLESSLMIQENFNEDHTHTNSQKEEKNLEENETKNDDSQACSIEKISTVKSKINDEILCEQESQEKKNVKDKFYETQEQNKFQDNLEFFNIKEKNNNFGNINNLDCNKNNIVKNENEKILEEKKSDKKDIVFKKIINRKHLKTTDNIIDIDNINNINNTDYNDIDQNNSNKNKIDIDINNNVSKEHSTISQNKNSSMNSSNKNNEINNNSINIANSNKNNNTYSIISLVNTNNNNSNLNNNNENNNYDTSNNININNYKYQLYNQMDTMTGQELALNSIDKNIINNNYNYDQNFYTEYSNNKSKDYSIDYIEKEEIQEQILNTIPETKKEKMQYSSTNDTNKNRGIIKNNNKIAQKKQEKQKNTNYSQFNKISQDCSKDKIEQNKSQIKINNHANSVKRRKKIPTNINIDISQIYPINKKNSESKYNIITENKKNKGKKKEKRLSSKNLTDFHQNFPKKKAIQKSRDKVFTTNIYLENNIVLNYETIHNTQTSIFNNWLIQRSNSNKSSELLKSERCRSVSELLKLNKNNSINKKENRVLETKQINNAEKNVFKKVKNTSMNKIYFVDVRNKKQFKKFIDKENKENKNDNNSQCKTQRLTFSNNITNILNDENEKNNKKILGKKKRTVTLFINNIFNNKTINASNQLNKTKNNSTTKYNNTSPVLEKSSKIQNKNIYKKINPKKSSIEKRSKNNQKNITLNNIYSKHEKLKTTNNFTINEKNKSSSSRKKYMRQRNTEIFQQSDINSINYGIKKIKNHNSKTKIIVGKLIRNRNNFINKTYLKTDENKKTTNINSTYTGGTSMAEANQNYENSQRFDDLKNNVLSKIFIFFDRDKDGCINLTKNNIEKQIKAFPFKIQKILSNMLNSLIFKNKEKTINKNEFIEQMSDLFSYLSIEDKNKLISCKNEISKMYQFEIFDTFEPKSCYRRFKVDLNSLLFSNKGLKTNNSKNKNLTQINYES